jgi:hypothetical protein
VLFGLQAARIRTLKKMKNSLSRLAAAGRLSKITTVGAGDSDLDAEERCHLHDLTLSGGFEQRGIQNESAISELLFTAAFGISGQNELSYEKSGTFMAYAAHELNILSEYGGEDSGEPLCWLITPAELQAGIPEPELRDRAKQLRAWQERTSSWELIAGKLSEALQLNIGATVFNPVAGQ